MHFRLFDMISIYAGNVFSFLFFVFNQCHTIFHSFKALMKDLLQNEGTKACVNYVLQNCIYINLYTATYNITF